MAPWLGRGTAIRRTCLSGSGSFTGNVRRTLGFLTRGCLCHPHVAAVLPLLFNPFIRDARLVGGNRGIPTCHSVDPLSIIIKCLRGEGHKSGDLVVPTIDKRPFPSGGQVNTHTALYPADALLSLLLSTTSCCPPCPH
jgi:hypothetical protein